MKLQVFGGGRMGEALVGGLLGSGWPAGDLAVVEPVEPRRKELGAIAKNAAEKVKEYGEAVRLEPMNAFERKCVHDVINALAGVESESEGVEPSRRIVVRPVD